MQTKTISTSATANPVLVFSAMRERFGAPTILLESLQFDENNKFSLIAAKTLNSVVTSKDSIRKIQEALKKAHILENNLAFKGGLLGVFSFEVFGEIEPKCKQKSAWPHAQFFEFSEFVFFNHETKDIVLFSLADDLPVLLDCVNKKGHFDLQTFDKNSFSDPALRDFSSFSSEMTADEHAERVKIIKDKILNGDIFQATVSNLFTHQFKKDGLRAYECLRFLEPTTHLFFLDLGDRQIGGSSPEILGSLRDGVVSYRPIAGTRFRGHTKQEDEKIFRELSSNEKENAEHEMLVDLGRNDLGRVCLPGTVQVTRDKYQKCFANVMHLVSDIQGQINRKTTNATDFFEAIFPAGTLTGAPKIRATEIIQSLEKSDRNLYAGAVGYFSADGNMELTIAIRSFYVENDQAFFRVGGGIVQDSKPTSEWLEIHNKAASMCQIFNYLQKN